jgi:hypothetical protein
VIDKRVTVILYGSDRNLWNGGTLKIQVWNLLASGGPKLLMSGNTDASTVELRLQLPFDAGQLYGLTFSEPDHRPAWQMIRRTDFIRTRDQIEADDLILRLMLVPDRPGTSEVAGGFDKLSELASPFAAPKTGIDAARFGRLDVAAKMAFLNIEAKLRETIIDGAPLISFVRAVRHVAVDRVFLLFDSALKPRMDRAADFAGAPGHRAPKEPAGLPDHPDSWKHTRYAEGNVQLSFSAEASSLAAGGGALVHSADVDIDLGRGLAHAKEWLENHVFKPGHKTNQALVYGQLYAQGILPQYTLDPMAATTRSVAPTLTRALEPPRTSRARRKAARRAGGKPTRQARGKPTRQARGKPTRKRTALTAKARKRRR